MFGEIIVVAVVLGLLGDVVTHGRVSAVLRGTTTGAARTGYRAAAGGVSAGLDATRTGRGTKATARGVTDAVRNEFARLPGNVRDDRAAADRARRDAQDPAVGARPGWLGRSFDRAPVVVINVNGERVEVPARDGVPLPTDADPLAPWRHVAERQDAARAARNPSQSDPAAPAAGDTATEGATPVTTAAATPNRGGPRPTTPPTSGGGHSVRVESIPGFVRAVSDAAALVQEISEQATANLKLAPGAAQTGLGDVIDLLRAAAANAHSTYNPLTEAADATPQGAEGVTVGQARSE